MFSKQGLILASAKAGEEKIMDAAAAAGADDIRPSAEGFEITCSPEDLDKVTEALKAAGIDVLSSEAANVAQTNVTLTGEKARAMLRMMDELENHDDVTDTSANFDIDDAEMEKFSNAQ
jgi:transcriptional/translational regulatory protein YebC/TACO1